MNGKVNNYQDWAKGFMIRSKKGITLILEKILNLKLIK